MKTAIVSVVILFLGCALAQQPISESIWTALETKVAAVNVTDFYLMLGNEDGLFFTYQQGRVADSLNYLNLLNEKKSADNARRTKVANTSRFSVASASKWVSSVLFNTLIHNGTMSLLDRPQDYIEWWTNDPEDRRSRVRVQHLLNFQSGFALDNDCVWDQQAIPEECVKSIYENCSVFEPGKSFVYSENHMHILALMATKKTGKTFAQLFEELLKVPLGLTVSAYQGNNPRPASSLSTNAIEYEKILRSIYMKTILPPDVIDMMEQDQTNVTIGLSPASDYGVSWHYALGHWVECPYETWDPSCLTEINRRSSPGGLGYYPWIDRKMNYYGIFATFQTKGFYSSQQVDGFREEIHAMLAALNSNPVAEPTSSPVPINNTPANSNNGPSSSVTAGSSQPSTMICLSLVLIFLAVFS